MLWRGLSAVAILWAASSDADDSCPAGSGDVCKEPRKLAADASADNSTAKVPVLATAELIAQEVGELRAFMQLCEKRMKLLEGLRRAAKSGKNMSLPAGHVRALQEKLPLLSEVSVDEDRAPHSSADDFLVSKAIIPQEEPVSFIKILPLRNPHNSGPTSTAQTAMPSALLVAVRADGGVRLFSPSGEMFLSFSAGHDQPVTHVAVSPSQDEYFLTTVDAGCLMRVHKVSVRQRWLTRDQKQIRRSSFDEKVSQFLGSQVNVTAQFTKTIKLRPGSNGELPTVTALTVASYQGTKYFVLGDADGKVSVYTRNGTFAGQMNASVTPGVRVESLYSHLSSLIFRVGNHWGFINLEKFEVQHMRCPKFQGRVTSAIMDSQQSSRMLVADEDGTVWVFNVKEKRGCKVEHRFPKGSTLGPVDLASVRGFVIALEQAPRGGNGISLVALNMSHVGKKRAELEGEMGIPSAVVWRQQRPAVRDWALHKRYQQGDLLAFLSEDGYEIEVMELLMQVYTAPSTESFANYQGPVIIVGICLVLGYQWMRSTGMFGGDDPEAELKKLAGMRKGKKKKKFGGGGGGGGFDF